MPRFSYGAGKVTKTRKKRFLRSVSVLMGKARKREWPTAIEAIEHSRPLAHIWMGLEAERRQESTLAVN